jgi:hypothetical protein
VPPARDGQRAAAGDDRPAAATIGRRRLWLDSCPRGRPGRGLGRWPLVVSRAAGAGHCWGLRDGDGGCWPHSGAMRWRRWRQGLGATTGYVVLTKPRGRNRRASSGLEPEQRAVGDRGSRQVGLGARVCAFVVFYWAFFELGHRIVGLFLSWAIGLLGFC